MRITARDGVASVSVSADSTRPIRVKGCGLVLAFDAAEARQLALALADAIEQVKTTEQASLGA